MSNKLKVTFIDNADQQYEGFANEIPYTRKKSKTGKLYLGDRHSCAMVQLKYRNCSAVVNCDTDLFGLAREKDIRYLKVEPCIDADDLQKCVNNAITVFELAFRFIEQELEAGHNVLVHCEKGITKSVAVITYFLMSRLDISLATAFKEVKRHRDVAMPQPSLFRHLIAAELKLRGAETVRIQGKQVIYLEKSSSKANNDKLPNDGNTTEKYFIGGVLVSIVAAVFIGIYLMAGKL